MGRFDVYRSAPVDGGGYLLDVQADLLRHLNTRVVVPLMSLDTAPRQARGLNPTFEVEGKLQSMLTQFLAAVPVRELGHPIGSLQDRGDDVMRALDILLTGV